MIFNICISFILLQSIHCSNIHVDIHDEAGVKHLYNMKINERDKRDSISMDTLSKQTLTMFEDDIRQIFENNLDDIFLQKTDAFSSNRKAVLENLEGFYGKTKSFESNSHKSKDHSFKPAASSDQDINDPKTDYNIYKANLWLQYITKIKKIITSSLWTTLEISEDCLKPELKLKLPYSLCNENLNAPIVYKGKDIEKYSLQLVDKLPHATGKPALNDKIARTVVLMNTGHIDKSIEELTRLLKLHPHLPVLYYIRSVAYLRLKTHENNKNAMNDIERTLKMETSSSEPHERLAGIYSIMGLYSDALSSAIRAVQLKPTWKNYYQRGLLYLLMEKWSNAEADLRRVLNTKVDDIAVMNHLGVVLVQKGKHWNAITVFNDILEIDASRLDTMLLLAETLKQVGDHKTALLIFKRALNSKPSRDIIAHVLQSRASLYYSMGLLDNALKDTEECIQNSPTNAVCMYVRSLCLTGLGHFYESIKVATGLMVLDGYSFIRISPEFIKIHYHREWARYIHARMERNISDYNVSLDLSPEFRDRWYRTIPIKYIPNYQEFPGLQPHIQDLTPPLLTDYSSEVQGLLCRVQKFARIFTSASDGFVDNIRVQHALSLGAIHVAQLLQDSSQHSLSENQSSPTWRSVMNLVVQYLSLADPSAPVFWMESMESVDEGYLTDKTIMRGEEENIQLMPYYNLVFQLLKTMVQYLRNDKVQENSQASFLLAEEIRKANNCQDLIRVAKKKVSLPNSGGLVVSTQVPSLKYRDESHQHDGDIILLAEDGLKRPILSLQVVISKKRLASYSEELDFVFSKFFRELLRIRQRASSGTADDLPEEAMNEVVDTCLTFLYYICNARPLSHSSTMVGFSVTVGMLLTLGMDVQGRAPPGKVLEMEPLVSGTPEAFVIVTKQWLKLNKSLDVINNLPSISRNFPTVRHILEILALSSDEKCVTL